MDCAEIQKSMTSFQRRRMRWICSYKSDGINDIGFGTYIKTSKQSGYKLIIQGETDEGIHKTCQ